ncbi:PIN domain-containing protein [Nocardioides sp. NPDC057764]|uniref:PIN domain-containing protein n=1 Tax=Nocardioides sp. NPDC057764 TaxID=3346243 RepID=UPI00366D438B
MPQPNEPSSGLELLRPVAVLDACVLVPRLLRDLLLTCADMRAFRPVWQDEIENEMIRNQVRRAVEKGRDKDAAQDEAEAAQAQMNRAFPGARLPTELWVPLVARQTNDTKDRHVLAAAAGSNATHLVTLNLRDFPSWSLSRQLSVCHPDRFLTELLATHRLDVVAGVTEVANRMKTSPLALGQRLAASQYVPGFGELLRSAL